METTTTANIEALTAELVEAQRAQRQAEAALRTANQAEKRLRRRLVREQREAGLLTEAGHSTSCTWQLEVPSGHPEPTSEADCWKSVTCGAAVTDVADGWECENGHHYFTYGSPSQMAEEREEALIESLMSELF